MYFMRASVCVNALNAMSYACNNIILSFFSRYTHNVFPTIKPYICHVCTHYFVVLTIYCRLMILIYQYRFSTNIYFNILLMHSRYFRFHVTRSQSHTLHKCVGDPHNVRVFVTPGSASCDGRTSVHIAFL